MPIPMACHAFSKLGKHVCTQELKEEPHVRADSTLFLQIVINMLTGTSNKHD